MRTRRSGEITHVNAYAGLDCAACHREGVDLRFAAFRRVIGLLIVDRIILQGGYFCRGCRFRTYLRFQALTLLFGWWGVIAMLLRNPYSLLANTLALFRPPLLPGAHGSLHFNDLRQAVYEVRAEQQALGSASQLN